MKEKVKDATRLIRKMGEKKKSSPLAEVSTITNQLHRGISHPDGLNFLDDVDESSDPDLKRSKGLRRNISEVNIADRSSGRRVSYEGSTRLTPRPTCYCPSSTIFKRIHSFLKLVARHSQNIGKIT